MIALLTIVLTPATTRLTRSYAVAQAAGPVPLVAPLFFCERFVGLGRLAWLWPLTTAAASWPIRGHFGKVKANRRSEAPFLAGFGYALPWRFCFPDLDASSEKLADLGFIVGLWSRRRW